MAGEYIEFDNNNQPAVNDTNLNRLQQLIKQDIQGAVSGDTLPIGTIVPFGSNTVPENWLLCDGSAVSRTTYQDLFNTIGITFGQGDGFETFNLPDLRDRVPIGKDINDTDFDALGKTAGNKSNTYNFNHTHAQRLGFTASYINGNGTMYTAGETIPQNVVATHDSKWSNISSTNIGEKITLDDKEISTVQPSIAINYIIKAFQSAGTVATVVDNLNSTSGTDALSANQGNALKQLLEGTVLYENTSGTTDDITLTNDEFTNYSRVKIFGFDDYGNYVSTEFLPNISKNVELSTIITGSGTHYLSTQEYTFTATALTKNRRGYFNVYNNSYEYQPTDHWIYITKIIGYNY